MERNRYRARIPNKAERERERRRERGREEKNTFPGHKLSVFPEIP